MHANLSKVGWAVLVGRLHPNVSARDIRSLGGSDAVSSFPFHLFTGLGPVLGTVTLRVSQRTLEYPVPTLLPALTGLPVALGARYKVPAPGSASVLLPPSSPPSLPVTHSTPATWASSLFWNPPATIQPQGLCTCCSLSTDPSSSSCSP